MDEIEIAFIGGSGLYQVPGLTNIKWKKVSSHFGNPSDKVCIGLLNNKKVAFLPRHGRKHKLSPSKINYRANIDCLKSLNVKNIISISAVGSLRSDYKPGDLVLVQQFIDKTFKRDTTFFDNDLVAHVQFSQPVCKNLNKISKQVLKKLKIKFHPTGTYVCIEGPQFSTLAESELYRSWGCDLIGMTNLPEAKLAREAGICYASLAMVTDYDCWHPDHESVTVEAIVKTMEKNSKKALEFIEEFSKVKNIVCGNSTTNILKDAMITDINNVSRDTKNKLKNILS